MSCALTIGVFDGVHKGHQALLSGVVDAAARAGDLVPTALTFDPHPAAVFAPSRVPKLITSVERRVELLRRHGAEQVVVVPFDRAFAAQTPDAFVAETLIERLGARVVVVGDDFRYGCDRRGDVAQLRAAGERHGFSVRVVPSLLVGGVPARSSVIRGMLSGGAVEAATALLGRPFSLEGVVVHGRQLGRTIGYPTANVASPAECVVPGAGVYAGRVRVDDRWHRAAISVGTNPTVTPDGPTTVEAFVMDGFDGDLYGKTIAVEFVAFVRGMEKFDGLDTLIAQMGRDIDAIAAVVPRP